LSAPPAPQGILLALPRRLGAAVLALAAQVGGLGVLLGKVVVRLRPKTLDGEELLRNLNRMGVRSVPIVAATAAFTGGIMVIQAAPILQQFSAEGQVGWSATFITVRELGPLLIGLMFNGRVGANNTAELATMKVTSQIDALRALAIDPIAYLVVPRVITMVVMMLVLCVLGDAVALGGAVVTPDLLLDVHPMTFWSSATQTLELWDFWVGIIKSGLFGLMIALTSCFFGLATTGGAPGVGRAVNSAVVSAAAGVFVVDYLSTFVLD